MTQKTFKFSSFTTVQYCFDAALNDLKKRYDIVVFNKHLKPILIVECKAPYIELDESVVEQALRYNSVIMADLLMITNGMSDLVFNSRNETVLLSDYNF